MSNSDIHPQIHSLLAQLRGRIRRYVLLEGISLVVALLGLLFWISLGLDYAYFKASNLELPRWFRAGFDVAVVCLFSAAFMTWIGLRILRGFRSKALALVLERRFPELNDRLVTAVELSESTTGRETTLTQSMLDRTVGDVTHATGQLNLGDVFEKTPLRRAVMMAVVLVASVGGLAWANADVVNRWKAGFLDLEEEYWRRDVGLIVKVVAQPGDMVREFRDFQYKHPRGGDLTLLIEVAEGKRVPERVYIKYRLAGGRGSGRAACSNVGERQFRHSIGSLLDSLEFTVTGGDFTNRTPYRVVVVNPPRIDRVVLESYYPDYTAKNRIDSETNTRFRDPVAVQGTQQSLPMETEFLLHAECNKPLVRVRIQYDQKELTFGLPESSGSSSGFVAKLTVQTEEGERQKSTPIDVPEDGSWISKDGKQFTVPFVLSSAQTDATRVRNGMIETQFGKPLLMHPDALVRIFLEDDDEIISAEPARLTINGIVDQQPIVDTQLEGIGTSITRKASIPLSGLITDDYGTTDARFEFLVDDEDAWQPRPFQNAPTGRPLDFRLMMSKGQEVERFEVLPLDLAVGQQLTLCVFAQDDDDLNGPHQSRSERYTFKIVSNEELLSLLYQKELNMRRRFERVLDEVKEIQKDLLLHRARIDERKKLVADGPRDEKEDEHRKKLSVIQNAVVSCAERSLHEIRQNANETAEIEQSFRDIREEMVNNAVDTRQMLERIDDRIVDSLHEINTRDYPSIDELIGLFKFANEKERDPTIEIDNGIDALSIIITRMERILLEMRKLETFQEALEILKSIIQQEGELIKKTKTEQKKKLIEGLKGLEVDKE